MSKADPGASALSPAPRKKEKFSRYPYWARVRSKYPLSDIHILSHRIAIKVLIKELGMTETQVDVLFFILFYCRDEHQYVDGRTISKLFGLGINHSKHVMQFLYNQGFLHYFLGSTKYVHTPIPYRRYYYPSPKASDVLKRYSAIITELLSGDIRKTLVPDLPLASK